LEKKPFVARRIGGRRRPAGRAGGAAPTLGQRLHELRQSKGWTLMRLADSTGLAPSTLSKVENDRMSLTYANLAKLAEGLGLDLAELFGDRSIQLAAGRRAVTRRGEGPVHDSVNYTHRYLCTDLAQKRLVPLHTRVKARSIEDFGPLLKHAGEEFVFVLEGEVEVHTEGEAPVRLGPGEAVYLDSTIGHGYVSVGRGEAVMLSVISAPALPPLPVRPKGYRALGLAQPKSKPR
jgi:transcriptional regulator with XRE-family HTH domain